jgi:hypothetical protein
METQVRKRRRVAIDIKDVYPQPATQANQITRSYAMALLSHTWSRHKVTKMYRSNGSHHYTTYHLTA